MSSEELERYRLELEYREKRESRRADMFRWFVAFAWPSLLQVLSVYYTSSKLETAAGEAREAKQTAAVVSEKTDAIAVAADASVKSWKAYQTKEPSDMDEATEAVEKAEKAHDKP